MQTSLKGNVIIFWKLKTLDYFKSCNVMICKLLLEAYSHRLSSSPFFLCNSPLPSFSFGYPTTFNPHVLASLPKGQLSGVACHPFVVVCFWLLATRRSPVPQLKRVLWRVDSAMSGQIRPLTAEKRVQLMPDIFLCAPHAVRGYEGGVMQIVEIFSTDQQLSGWFRGNGFPPFHAVVIGFCLMELERGNNFIELDFNIAQICLWVWIKGTNTLEIKLNKVSFGLKKSYILTFILKHN